MNDLKIFEFENKQVRTLSIKDEPYFVGKDVAKILGYEDVNRAVNQHVSLDDRCSLSRKGSGDLCITLWNNDNDWANKVVINESGVYSLIFDSKLPKAKKFKHWVTSEVLPAIRKHGAYLTNEKAYDITHNKDALADLLIQAGDQLKQAQAKIKEMKPKESYYDNILQCKELVTITEIAKDYGITAFAMNKILSSLDVQYKQGNKWFLYKKYQDKGWAKSSTYYLKEQDKAVSLTKWTQAGRAGLYKLLKKHSILPAIEKESLA